MANPYIRWQWLSSSIVSVIKLYITFLQSIWKYVCSDEKVKGKNKIFTLKNETSFVSLKCKFSILCKPHCISFEGSVNFWHLQLSSKSYDDAHLEPLRITSEGLIYNQLNLQFPSFFYSIEIFSIISRDPAFDSCKFEFFFDPNNKRGKDRKVFST